MTSYRFRTRPFKHQRRASLAAAKARNYALFMEPRTGKTKTALDAAAILVLKGLVRRILVATTLDGIGVWEDELELHYPFQGRRVSIGDSPCYFNLDTSLARLHPVVGRADFFILNHEQFRRRAREGKRWEYPVSASIEKWHPDLIIWDESHALKRAGGVTAQLAWRSVRRMRQRDAMGRPFVFLLSGTPNPKGWIDIFSQFRVMDDSIFGTNKADFEDRYVEYGTGHRKYTIVKYRREKEILRKVKQHSFRISRDKALDLPPQMWQNVPVVLPTKARRLYEDMATQLVAEIDGNRIEAANAGVRRLRLLQLTGGFLTDGTKVHGAKIDAATSIFHRTAGEDEERMVVYARFRPEVRALGAALDKLGIPNHQITGKTPRQYRREARREFARSPGMVLVFQVATGSMAISLSSAHEVLFYSLPDGWLQYWQATGRVHDVGQTEPVRYRHLIARGTLDRSVLHTLKEKGDVHGALMGNPKDFLWGMIQ